MLLNTTHLPAQLVPEYLNYQGLLKAADGSPLATGNYTIEFNVYDQANPGGNKVWGPFLFDGNAGNGHSRRVPVVNGGFNVIIGPKDTGGHSIANAFTGPNRFIEIRLVAAARSCRASSSSARPMPCKARRRNWPTSPRAWSRNWPMPLSARNHCRFRRHQHSLRLAAVRWANPHQRHVYESVRRYRHQLG